MEIKEEEEVSFNFENVKIEPIFQVETDHNDDNLIPLYNDRDKFNSDIENDCFCYDCQIYFTTWNMLGNHTRFVHKTIECFKCLLCFKIYYKLAAFVSHVVNEHDIDHAHCIEDCLERLNFYGASNGNSFGGTFGRIAYQQKSKAIVTTFDNAAQVLSCNECNYKCKNKRSLATHVAKHLVDSKCSCAMCGRTYKKRRNLTYHIRFVHSEETCICDWCGKSFATSNSLYRHRKFVHYGGKHECKICHRVLTSEKNLNDHMANYHMDNRSLKTQTIEQQNVACGVCAKTFSRPDSLRNHMRIHTGEKPYTCTICEASFTKKNSLKQHLILHTGAKPYVCDICGKQFSQKPGLTNHRKSHPGSNPPLPPMLINPIIDGLLQ